MYRIDNEPPPLPDNRFEVHGAGDYEYILSGIIIVQCRYVHRVRLRRVSKIINLNRPIGPRRLTAANTSHPADKLRRYKRTTVALHPK